MKANYFTSLARANKEDAEEFFRLGPQAQVLVRDTDYLLKWFGDASELPDKFKELKWEIRKEKP